MPANYANFYIGNDVVLAPYFPDRQVIGVDCRSIIWGLGAIHDLPQQVPQPN